MIFYMILYMTFHQALNYFAIKNQICFLLNILHNFLSH